MCLKDSLKFFIFLLLFCSCTTVRYDPAKKYNEEFLKNNGLKIRAQKSKHMKIAKENDIYYRDNKTDLIDSKYYNSINGTKLKREYKNTGYIDEEKKKEEIKYLDSDLSICYRERKLKDSDISDSCTYNCGDIVYLENNYKDYSKDRVNFDDVEPSREQLYGSLMLRKEKEYNYIDNITMQRNFDYIDIMNRVKREIYLKEKEEENRENNKNTGVVNSIKNRFRNLFK